jgi:hypothetical protein
MMKNKTEILQESSFGSRIAEDEIDELRSYFVETESWRKVISGDVDIVFGSKGAGKSALYSLLVAQKEALRLGRRTLFLPAENPRGTPVFRDLTSEPPLSEEEFKGLWKLYFLSIAADYLRHHLTSKKIQNREAGEVFKFLEGNGLLAQNSTLFSRLKAVFHYIKKSIPSFEASVTDPHSGHTFSGKITLNEPTTEERKLGFRSLDDLLASLNNALKIYQITIWLALDRLDVAFSESDELEGNAIRSLFRSYLDMMALTQIRLKIFLRDDIWRKVVRDGFREASHITRSLSLAWDSQSLLNLIVRRILSNQPICDYYGIDKENVLANADLQNEFFYKVFPDQIDKGSRMPKTIDWMLSRTADGTRMTAPRELIHLLLATRDHQLRLNQLGSQETDQNRLFDRTAIRSALPEVSKVRYDQTLCAEHPSLKCFLDKLEREKTQQSIKSLAKLWKCTELQAIEITEKLVETGFFERRGTKENPSYWVPFLYRDALRMIQGSAQLAS